MLDIGSSSVLRNVSVFRHRGALRPGRRGVLRGAAPTMRNVVAIASGGTHGEPGRGRTSTPRPSMENVVAIATGARPNNVGVLSLGATSSPTHAARDLPGDRGHDPELGLPDLHRRAAHDGRASWPRRSAARSGRGRAQRRAGAGLSLSRVRAVASGASSLSAGVYHRLCSPRITTSRPSPMAAVRGTCTPGYRVQLLPA